MQVAVDNPQACPSGMGWNPVATHQPIPSGSRLLIMGDSLVRDLIEIFARVQTTAVIFGGASVAEVIKMMEFHNEGQLDTLMIMIGTN